MDNQQAKSFKHRFSEEQRKQQTENMRKNEPDKVPLIIEQHANSKLEQMKNTQFIMNDKLRVYQVNTIVRKRMNLNKVDALYLFVNGSILLRGGKPSKKYYINFYNHSLFIRVECKYQVIIQTLCKQIQSQYFLQSLIQHKQHFIHRNQSLRDVYQRYKDPDGYIYLSYCEYGSFGSDI